MFKRKLAFPILLALLLSSSTAAVGLAASIHGGGFGAALPQYVIPASADLYVALDRSGTQGTALTQLWNTYQSHPGTAAALASLSSMVGAQSMAQLNSVLSSFGDRFAVALWLPTSSGPGATARVAIVAQLKMSSFANGGNPFSSFATLTPSSTYRGVTVYRVTFSNGGGNGYAAAVMGYAVLTPDLATLQQVLDTATFHAPSLATNNDFATTMAQLPFPRALTFYLSASYFKRLQQLSGAPGGATPMPPQLQALSSAYAHPIGLAMVAAPDGLEFVTSVFPTPSAFIHLTPNAGAGMVGNNVILYASMADLADTIKATGLLNSSQLTSIQQQSGIDVQNDLLGWMTGELFIDLNTDVSPILGLALAAVRQGSNSMAPLGPGPALPGSLELGWNVTDPAAVQRSLDHVIAALNKSASSSGTSFRLVTTTLPDGTVAHVLPGLPSLGYAFRGHWLILSTSLANDLQAAATPLSTDVDYAAALTRVGGSASLVTTSYMDISRLLRAVDKWVAYADSITKSGGAQTSRIPRGATALIRPLRSIVTHALVPAIRQAQARVTSMARRGVRQGPNPNSLTAIWRQIEPFFAPVRSIVSVTRQVGAGGTQGETFVTVR